MCSGDISRHAHRLRAHCLKLKWTGKILKEAQDYCVGTYASARQYAARHHRLLGLSATIAVMVAGLAGKGIVNHIEVAAGSSPLAPAPAPPAPPVHHVYHRFFSSPLHGLASWYGSIWNGRTTASGETYDETQMTAAHKSLPLGTLVRVTNLRSMRTVVVRINDRGAFGPNRVIDLSSAAAREIGMMENGLAKVKLEVIGKL